MSVLFASARTRRITSLARLPSLMIQSTALRASSRLGVPPSRQRRQGARARAQRELHLGIEEALFASAQLLFRPLAVGDIAAHVPDANRLPGLRIVDPKGRIEDRDRISGLEMAEMHLSRPGTLL